jgi:hypothetical protein
MTSYVDTVLDYASAHGFSVEQAKDVIEDLMFAGYGDSDSIDISLQFNRFRAKDTWPSPFNLDGTRFTR